MDPKQLDGVCALYGVTSDDLIGGKVPDKVVYNMSASLNAEVGETMSHFALMFHFLGIYSQEAEENAGGYTDFSNWESAPF